MGRIVSVALAIAVMAGAVTASRADVTMAGGKTVKLKNQTGTANDQALIKFTKEMAFTTRPPNPMCPTVSTIRLRTDTQDVLTTLDCTHWSLTGSGYAYHDITAGAGGVEKIVLAAKSQGGKLLIKMHGTNYGVNAISGPIAFLETQLTIDTASYCGRFENPPSVFKSNEQGKVGISGPSTVCIPATPTVTGTATDTATATATATATPMASSISTCSCCSVR